MIKVADPAKIVGRKIVEFKLQPFDDGRGGIAYDPIITLDDGSFLAFDVIETEVGECYGIRPMHHNPLSRHRKRNR